jgi:hypothetical protein
MVISLVSSANPGGGFAEVFAEVLSATTEFAGVLFAEPEGLPRPFPPSNSASSSGPSGKIKTGVSWTQMTSARPARFSVTIRPASSSALTAGATVRVDRPISPEMYCCDAQTLPEDRVISQSFRRTSSALALGTRPRLACAQAQTVALWLTPYPAQIRPGARQFPPGCRRRTYLRTPHRLQRCRSRRRSGAVRQPRERAWRSYTR